MGLKKNGTDRRPQKPQLIRYEDYSGLFIEAAHNTIGLIRESRVLSQQERLNLLVGLIGLYANQAMELLGDMLPPSEFRARPFKEQCEMITGIIFDGIRLGREEWERERRRKAN